MGSQRAIPISFYLTGFWRYWSKKVAPDIEKVEIGVATVRLVRPEKR